MELVYEWDEKCLAIGELSTCYLENSWDKGNPEFLKTNSIKNLHMLWKYLHHLVREAQESSIPGNLFSILLPDQFCNLTWKEFMTWTPIRIQALYLILDTEDKQSKTPGTNPIRMPTNSVLSRKASRGKYHNTPCSRMRSILRLFFWSQPQHMAVWKSWKESTCLDMMMIVRNYLNKNSISCTMFSTKYYKVKWVKP